MKLRHRKLGALCRLADRSANVGRVDDMLLRVVRRRGLHTAAALPPVLVRDFIRDSLYATEGPGGYFVKRDVIYAPPTYIDFNNLLGHMEYKQVLAKLYAQSEHAWLTPVLVFQPWYSYAIARWLVKALMALRARGGQHIAAPLVVYEVGGGTGTNARHICNYVRANAPQLYRGMSYTILEISPSLHERQMKALSAHAAVARSIVADATNLSAVGVSDERHCFVVACEVLDNLPHDKVVKLSEASSVQQATPSKTSDNAEQLRSQGWQQVAVTSVPEAAPGDGREAFRETLQPLSDPVIAEALPFVLSASASNANYKGGLASKVASAVARLFRPQLSTVPNDRAPLPLGVAAARYVPTGCLQLLRSLRASFPRHGLWLADFDVLPPPAIDFNRSARDDNVVVVPGGYYPARTCAPLVASKGGAQRTTVDHPTYLSPRRGIADIFFPTDFEALASMVRHTRGQQRQRQRGDDATAAATATGGASDGVRVLRSSQFLATFGDSARTRTLSGYNPLLEDYANTRVLVADLPLS